MVKNCLFLVKLFHLLAIFLFFLIAAILFIWRKNYLFFNYFASKCKPLFWESLLDVLNVPVNWIYIFLEMLISIFKGFIYKIRCSGTVHRFLVDWFLWDLIFSEVHDNKLILVIFFKTSFYSVSNFNLLIVLLYWILCLCNLIVHLQYSFVKF